MVSALISSDVKAAAKRHCQARGLKLGHFVEAAIVEQLEDALDLERYLQRKDEPTVSLESVLRSRKPKTRAKRASK